MLKQELQDSLGFVVSEDLYEKLNSVYENGDWSNNVAFRDYLTTSPFVKPFIDELTETKNKYFDLLHDDDVVAKTIIEVANNLYSEENIYNLLDYCANKLMGFKDKIWYKLDKGFRLRKEEIEYLKNHIK